MEAVDLPSPTRLKWELPTECVEMIEYSSHCALALLNDVDLEIFVHDVYGKGFMKTCRISPDAYIQMALQLAYFRVREIFGKNALDPFRLILGEIRALNFILLCACRMLGNSI